MQTLSTLSIALVMALAFGGPVVFTSAPAHAGDEFNRGWECVWAGREDGCPW